jgi:hypothetical protein
MRTFTLQRKKNPHESQLFCQTHLVGCLKKKNRHSFAMAIARRSFVPDIPLNSARDYFFVLRE